MSIISCDIDPYEALVGNPIKVTVVTNTKELVTLNVSYKVNTLLYSSSAIPDSNNTCVFFINDILRPLLNIIPLDDSEDVWNYVPDSVLFYFITAMQGSSSDLRIGKLSPGQIGTRLFRKLKSSGQDIFEIKYRNTNANFFLTTRGEETIIPMRESEIDRLYLLDQTIRNFECKDIHGNSIAINLLNESFGFITVNLKEIRKRFLQMGSLASYFRFYIDNKAVVSVALMESADQYIRLLFKNSYGVYEVLELSGVVKNTPQLAKRESYNKYDSVINDFVKTVDRGRYEQAITIQTGYKTTSEINFIVDMLLSEDVYLITDNERIEVIVTSNKITNDIPVTSPTSIELTITAKDFDTSTINNLITYVMYVLADTRSRDIITKQSKQILVYKKE